MSTYFYTCIIFSFHEAAAQRKSGTAVTGINEDHFSFGAAVPGINEDIIPCGVAVPGISKEIITVLLVESVVPGTKEDITVSL